MSEQTILTDAYTKGYKDAQNEIQRYIRAQIGCQRLAPSRAWMRDWNRSMERLAAEVVDLPSCWHPIDAVYWNEANGVHQCHACGEIMICHPTRGWVSKAP